MNRLTKTLALAAGVIAGALGATAAQASAANFNVNFALHNLDASASMIRVTSPLPSGVSGLIDPAAAISPGGYDPATGNAVFSRALPALFTSIQTTLKYANASDGISNPCTFTIQVSKDLNPSPYLLHFSVDDTTHCSVPADVRSSTGQFPSQTYVLNWAT
jgi:hypothetical protein